MRKYVFISVGAAVTLGIIAAFIFPSHLGDISKPAPSYGTTQEPLVSQPPGFLPQPTSFGNASSQYYENRAYGFGVRYPADFTLDTNVDTLQWEFATSLKVVARINAPESLNDKTNLGEAGVDIAVSADNPDISTCYAPQDYQSFSSIKQIGSDAWRKALNTGAAAGNRYEIMRYSVMRNNRCYVMYLYMHWGDISNYPPSSGVREFDKAKAFAALDVIADNFAFIGQDSPPSPSK
jgi:hypothetical protein